MPDWKDLLDEIKSTPNAHDITRRKYLYRLHKLTQRNVIIYYSGWLQKPDAGDTDINDNDLTGFMTAIHGMDRKKGLDLVLHTPGGDAAATEAIVDYLRNMFGDNIRAIVPQIAMSAGTMISCSCNKIIMGKHSSLGPIDPQFGGIAAHSIIEEFEQASQEISADPTKRHLWQFIIAQYDPTLIGECKKAIQWSEDMVRDWLITGMLKNESYKEVLADKIVNELGDHSLTLSHRRHLSAQKCSDMGLNVQFLERSQRLQDAVLTLHHATMHTLTNTPAVKIIENHEGAAYIKLEKYD
jgi:membrane-bound ClpP family serine protease